VRESADDGDEIEEPAADPMYVISAPTFGSARRLPGLAADTWQARCAVYLSTKPMLLLNEAPGAVKPFSST
jgi:hypothetical protein